MPALFDYYEVMSIQSYQKRIFSKGKNNEDDAMRDFETCEKFCEDLDAFRLEDQMTLLTPAHSQHNLRSTIHLTNLFLE